MEQAIREHRPERQVPECAEKSDIQTYSWAFVRATLADIVLFVKVVVLRLAATPCINFNEP